jgi:hypothetical protein
LCSCFSPAASIYFVFCKDGDKYFKYQCLFAFSFRCYNLIGFSEPYYMQKSFPKPLKFLRHFKLNVPPAFYPAVLNAFLINRKLFFPGVFYFHRFYFSTIPHFIHLHFLCIVINKFNYFFYGHIPAGHRVNGFAFKFY